MDQKKENQIRNIGIDVPIPKETCTDKKCPFHGDITLRGKTFKGTVIRAKMDKSAVVEWEYRIFVKKYERYQKKKSRIKTHNPPCINAHEGDKVVIMETRPLSKKVSSVIIKIEGQDKQHLIKGETE